MDKLILSMPENVIKKYLEEHFNELTFTDFLELRDRNINISSKLFNSNLDLLKNKEVITYIFKTNNEIPEFITGEIIYNNVDVSFADVKNYDSVRNNVRLIHYAYKNNPRVFLLFPPHLISYKIAREAVANGVVATEKDILLNPTLKDIAPLMEASIKNDSTLIKYVTMLCGVQLSDEVITEALSNYKLTKEDLINNPELCGIFNIISKVPEFRLYSTFLTEEERIAEVERLLKEKNFEELSDLPFFKKEFNCKASGENINWLASFITKDIQEEDLFEQKRYQKVLDYMVDGIVANMYHKDKFGFIYPDTVAMANDLKKYFFKAKASNSSDVLHEFVTKLNDFVNLNKQGKKFISYDYLLSRVDDLYSNYLIDETSIFNNTATIFYNEILNVHRNSYCSREKNKILTKLKYRLPLTEKKKVSINNGKKLIKIAYLLATHKYETLGITRDDLKLRVIEVQKEISSNKDLLKDYGIISKEIFDYFNTFFLNSGQLDYLTISHMLGTNGYEVIQYIFKKYEQIKVELLDRVELSKTEKEIKQEQIAKIGLNIFNFKIASNEFNLRNIATMLLCITDEEIDKIKENQQHFGDILKIIPFADMIPNFDIEILIKIMGNYGKIKNKIIKNNFITSNDMSVISKFDDVIGLANGYDSMNSLYEVVLGKEVLEKIGVANSKEYFDFYAEMRKKVNSSIPRISFEYDGNIYESGNHFDTERLIIGKSDSPSCVDLINTAGKDTFVECLAGTDANVIMIRDKDNDRYFGRILIFREGNMVQLACAYNQNGKLLQYPDDFYKVIAEQIIRQANEVGDNIDYVFLTRDAIKETSFQEYENVLFETAFPHADFWKYSYLVATNPLIKEKEVESNLDFFGQAKCVYPKIRQEIKDDASEMELTRLKALRVAMENDEMIKNELEKSFVPFYKQEFERVISGEDWYIALRGDGSIEELVLPSTDSRTMIEFEKAKEMIRSIQGSDAALVRK